MCLVITSIKKAGVLDVLVRSNRRPLTSPCFPSSKRRPLSSLSFGIENQALFLPSLRKDGLCKGFVRLDTMDKGEKG